MQILILYYAFSRTVINDICNPVVKDLLLSSRIKEFRDVNKKWGRTF